LFDTKGERYNENIEAKIFSFLRQRGHYPSLVFLVSKFSDAYSATVTKTIAFTKKVQREFQCNVVVVLTYAGTKKLGDIADCREKCKELVKMGKRKEAKLLRWKAWREQKERILRGTLGDEVPIVCIENDYLCPVNDKGERILPNGEQWIPVLVKEVTKQALKGSPGQVNTLCRGYLESEDAEVKDNSFLVMGLGSACALIGVVLYHFFKSTAR